MTPAVPDLAESDAPAVSATLAVVRAQRPMLVGLGGLFAGWAWGWFIKVVGGFVISWCIDAIVLALAGWTVLELVEWLKARLTKVSAESKAAHGIEAASIGPDGEYAAYADADVPGFWHVLHVGSANVVATFPDGEAEAKGYAALKNTGMPIA